MALMEKRLSEYFSVALMEDTVIKRFYEHGSFIQNEEAHIMANVLTALNSVDFRYISICNLGSMTAFENSVFFSRL